MSLDRSRLTKDEATELLWALRYYELELKQNATPMFDEETRRDARWRLFVVRSLLETLEK